MKWIGFRFFAAGLAAASLGGAAQDGDGPTFDHQAWNEVLSRFVDERGRVDYEALSRDREALDRYLSQIAEIGPRSTPERFPTRSHQLAYYVNAYNYGLPVDGSTLHTQRIVDEARWSTCSSV